ncbi:MAG: beta strand repeat-containing protein [Burkholderiales bacterium]
MLLQVDTSGPADGAQWTTLAKLSGLANTALTSDNFVYHIAPTGNTQPVSFSGTVASELLEGWDGADTITGGGGNDTIDGGFGGGDFINGDAGNDMLFGFSGNDTLDGGPDTDVIFGGDGLDSILGGAGDDGQTYFYADYKGTTYYRVFGLRGEAGNDFLDGGDGNDALFGGSGADTLQGGTGNDKLFGDEGYDIIRGGSGDDFLYAALGYSGADANEGASLYGDAGNDLLWATDYGSDATQTNNYFDGGDGNDTLGGAGSNSTLIGGLGNDQIDYGSITASVTGVVVDAGEGDDNFNGPFSGTGFTLSGGAGNDTMRVGGTSHTIDGGPGNDFIQPQGIGHLINAGAGNDTIDLEASSQFIESTGTGTVTTGADSDTVRLSLRGIEYGRAAPVITDFTIGAVTDADKLDLGAVLGRLSQLGFTYSNPFTNGWLRLAASGADTLVQADTSGPGNGAQWTTLATMQNVSPANLTRVNFVNDISPTGFANPQLIAGTAGADTLAGADGNDTINGGGGNDLLDGGLGGSDALAGEAGNDFLLGFTGDDTLDGGPDTDVIYGGDGFDSILGGAGDDATTYFYAEYKGISFYRVFGLRGEAGNDFIDGGDGNDYLSGGSGDDTLQGGVGNDTLQGDEGYDVVRGGAGDDALYATNGAGGAGNGAALYGEAGNDTLTAEQFYGFNALYIDNYFDGGEGNDTIHGTGSNSTLVGGLGNDTIIYPGTSGATLIQAINIDGGEGDDSIDAKSTDRATNWTIAGGAGNDIIRIAGDAHLINGGAGSDLIDLENDFAATSSTLSHLTGTGTITTGADSDIMRLSLRGLEYGRAAATITDLTPGAGGDKVDLSVVLGRLAQLGYDYANPFTSGWLQLLVSGSNTLLQVDTSGPANGAQWLMLATLQNVAPAALTEANFVDRISPTGIADPLNFTGTTGPDTLLGGDGNDIISGLGDNDLLDGGFGGNDSILGGVGNDLLLGFTGNDTLDGGLDNDAIHGGAGDDSLLGGAGDESGAPLSISHKGALYAIGGLFGGDGNDYLDGGDGLDSLSGGNGNDTLLGSAGNDTLDGNAGDDQLFGGEGNDRLEDRLGSNSIDGGNGNDTIFTAASGTNTITGGGGRDTFELHPANPNIKLGPAPIITDFSVGIGGDFLNVSSLGGGGNAFAAGFLRLVQSGAHTQLQSDHDGAAGNLYSFDTAVILQNIKASTITSANFVGQLIVGTPQADTLEGGIGDDTLQGLEGSDILDGAVGGDRMEGGPGSDTYYVDDALDEVFEANNTPAGGSGLRLDADLSGITDLVIAARDYLLTNFVENLTLAPGSAAMTGGGNTLANVITGNANNNTLEGKAGNDSIDGGAGVDAAAFSGTRLGYTIAAVSSGYTVTDSNTADGDEGTDTLTNIERISFAGLTLNLGSANLPTGSVTVGGTATQGQTLAASNTLGDVDGLGPISYQWHADGVDISGANAINLVLTQAQVGKLVTVSASYTDGLGAAERVTSVATSAVANINDAPVAASYPNQSGNVGQPVSLSLAQIFSDVDAGDVLNFGASGLPSGLAIDNASGQISGTAPGATGTHHITVTATDSGGLSASLSFDLKITNIASIAAGVLTRDGGPLPGVSGQEVANNIYTFSRGINDFLVNGTTKPITAADALDALKLSVGLAATKGSSWRELISADMTKDGKVTAADALEILKTSVGINTIQPSWVFVPTDPAFNPNLGSISRSNVTYSNEYNLANPSATSASITGILVGDVNNSWVIPA